MTKTNESNRPLVPHNSLPPEVKNFNHFFRKDSRLHTSCLILSYNKRKQIVSSNQGCAPFILAVIIRNADSPVTIGV